jgi:hypothetical protein
MLITIEWMFDDGKDGEKWVVASIQDFPATDAGVVA